MDNHGYSMKFDAKRTFLIGVVFLSICILNGAHDNATNKILTYQFGMKETWSGLIMAIDNILALFMLPIFGKLSDGCTSRLGKRKPFVLAGTIAGCVFLMLFPLALKGTNPTLFIVFICLQLVAMATYRSAGVSLVSDITIKPFRSKANAIINVMGVVGGLVSLLLFTFLYKDPDPTKLASGVVSRSVPIILYYALHIALTIIAILVYVFKIDEKKMSDEKERIEEKFNLNEDIIEEGTKIKLDKSQMTSFVLILLAIFFWTFGMNAVTTKYAVYATKEWGMQDGSAGITMIIAQVSAFAAFIPVGNVATKIGRRKTIMFGLLVALVAFAIGIFVKVSWAMYIVFVLAGIANASVVVNTLPMVVEFSNSKTIGQFTGIYYVATQSAAALTPLLVGIFMDNIGFQVLFPYGAIFCILAFVPLIFVKHGDAKPAPKGSALELLDIDD